ncbi:hypothetical protein ACNNMX_01895 [Aerococcus viridans]|uniref:hypothetical protein n=1 Tax=Aerococcus viridans TaxID=1377 RepID=UPI003AA8BDE6
MDDRMIPLSVLREYMPKLKDEDLKELGPVEYNQSKVPEVSKKHAENVRRKAYLPDMTESFARGVEYAGLIASEAVDISNGTNVRQSDLESQFTEIQQEITGKDVISAPEIIASRNGFNTLDERLTTQEQEVGAQLGTKVSYPILDGEVGVVNVTYPYGDVKRYGATGVYSETKDDSVYFQNAIDSAYNLKGGVNISAGVYGIKKTIYLPPVIRIYSSDNKVSSRGQTDGTIINTYVNEVLKPKTGTDCKLDMENLFFYNREATQFGNSVLFSGFRFSGSRIRRNNFDSYAIVLLSGLTGISVFEQNNVVALRYAFIAKEHKSDSGITTTSADGIVDSFVKNNYINGNQYFNAVAFDKVNISSSVISQNYIDFFKYAFNMGNGYNLVTVEGNIIDFCYRGFIGRLTQTVIANNCFFHLEKSEAPRFPNATSEMVNNDWVAICCDGSYQITSPEDYGFNTSTISNNNVTEVDTFLFVRGTNKSNVKVVGNTYSPSVKTKIDYFVSSATWINSDQKGIYMDDLMYQEYQTLPSPLLTGEGIASFNKQVIFYQNKMLTNINGQWIDATGNVVTA